MTIVVFLLVLAFGRDMHMLSSWCVPQASSGYTVTVAIIIATLCESTPPHA